MEKQTIHLGYTSSTNGTNPTHRIWLRLGTPAIILENLKNNAQSVYDLASQSCICLAHSQVGESLGDHWQPVVWDHTNASKGEKIFFDKKNGNFKAEGKFLKVSASVSIEAYNGTQRSDSEIRLVIDNGDGKGFVPATGTVLPIYNRTTDRGEGSASFTIVLPIPSSGIQFRMEARRQGGGSNLRLRANGSMITIEC